MSAATATMKLRPHRKPAPAAEPEGPPGGLFKPGQVLTAIGPDVDYVPVRCEPAVDAIDVMSNEAVKLAPGTRVKYVAPAPRSHHPQTDHVRVLSGPHRG